jgi:5-oxoprolinase (ATP-hydrolysing) subunit C
VSLLVINPGLCTTVQDLGRPGYREWGVSPGGAFDRRSLGLANALLGNPPDAAALELTLVGGIYKTSTNLAIALTGAPMEATIDPLLGPRRNLQIPQTATLNEGDLIAFGGSALGARTYFAVKAGWQVPVLLGSRSREDRLSKGDLLSAAPSTTLVRRLADGQFKDPCGEPLRIVAGPDAVRGGGQPRSLEEHPFRVGHQSDRTGLRLEGPPVAIEPEPERVSTPVAPGALQVAGGSIILLGVACGTMGGYPHIAHVITADLDRVGQLRPGDMIRFRVVSIDEAHRLDRYERNKRAAWLAGIAAVSAVPVGN